MAEKAEKKNEVAVKEEAGALAAIDFSADAGQGFEGAGAQAYAIPFLRVLQSTSPQCKKKDAGYIEGAEEGDLFNTVTEEVFKGDNGVVVIPCCFIQRYNEWAPDRGGFRGSHTVAEYEAIPKEIKTDSKGNQYEANADTGNQLADCREHYVLLVKEDGTTEPALLAIGSTEIKKSRKWMSLMQSICGDKLPMFSQMYRITTVGESNDKGSWAGLKIEHIGQIQSLAHYEAAKKFNQMVRSGAMKAAPPDGDVPF